MRPSSWNRNVRYVVFQFWRAQLTNWSNKKQPTELSVGGCQTLLHDGTRMRAFPTAGRLVISIFEGTNSAFLKTSRRSRKRLIWIAWRLSDHPTVAGRLP